MNLTDVEARVLGALIEKDVTTPDYYPLSLNALVNACNQKNNREPVMNLDEDAVREGLAGLEQQRLAGQARGADSRVPKFEHRLQEVFNFTRAETAVICVLLLRGPQTPGELRGRTDRLFHFEDLSSVQSTLQRLMQREEPLLKPLPRQPGTKETRYMHLLSGDKEPGEFAAGPSATVGTDMTSTTGNDGRVAQLEEEVRALRNELDQLRQEFVAFRKQF
ncbi:MAG TPA: YceH family protein [Terriglobales bacterium]